MMLFFIACMNFSLFALQERILHVIYPVGKGENKNETRL